MTSIKERALETLTSVRRSVLGPNQEEWRHINARRTMIVNEYNINEAKRRGIRPVSIEQILQNEVITEAGMGIHNIVLSDNTESLSCNSHNWVILGIDQAKQTATIHYSQCEGYPYSSNAPIQVSTKDELFTGFIELKIADNIGEVNLQEVASLMETKGAEYVFTQYPRLGINRIFRSLEGQGFVQRPYGSRKTE